MVDRRRSLGVEQRDDCPLFEETKKNYLFISEDESAPELGWV